MQPILPEPPSPTTTVTVNGVIEDSRWFEPAYKEDFVNNLGAIAFSMARNLTLTETSISADDVEILVHYVEGGHEGDTLRADEDDGVIRQSDEVHEHFLRLLEQHGAHVIR